MGDPDRDTGSREHTIEELVERAKLKALVSLVGSIASGTPLRTEGETFPAAISRSKSVWNGAGPNSSTGLPASVTRSISPRLARWS